MKSSEDRELRHELLTAIYNDHRSGFVHGGKEVSNASALADAGGLTYFKHYQSGKETRTPGLQWFARIVRATILGFLYSLPEPAEVNDELLAELAREGCVLHLKARRKVKAGEPIQMKDVYYQ